MVELIDTIVDYILSIDRLYCQTKKFDLLKHLRGECFRLNVRIARVIVAGGNP